MQKLYNDAMEMINLLSSKKDFLNENEVVQLTRANNIVTFFERLFLHTHVDIIKEAIYNIFIDKIEKAIESNNNELKNLNIQLQTIIAQRDSYKRRLENNDELAEQTNIKKKKIITNHQYIDGKIKFLNMKRLALQQEIDFIQEFKSKNEQMKQKFIYNPTDFISDFIRETYLDVDSFLANQLNLNLKEVNNVIGDIVLHPGYDSKKKQNSLINKDKLNVILMKLVINYMQNEDTILLQTVKENWQLEIEITKSHISLFSRWTI